MTNATAIMTNHSRSSHRFVKRTAGILAVLAFALLSGHARAQGTVAPMPQLPFITSTGAICSGCLLYTYEPGTTTPLSTYTDSALTVAHANPIVLNAVGWPSASGNPAAIYLSPRTYKFVLKTSAGVDIWTRDNVPAAAANGSMAFPSTQVASSNAWTLDDYEEGTWVPVIGGSGGTSGQGYTNQEGRYIKIGSMVWASFYALLGTEGTITGNVQIQGLPFAAETGVLNFYTGSLIWDSLATNWVSVQAYVAQNTTTAPVVGAAAAAATNTTPLTAADINNTTGIRGLLVYRAAN